MAVIHRAARIRTEILNLPLSDPMALRTAPGLESPTIFELEQRCILPSCWAYIGTAASLDQPGDYVAAKVGAEPVVVVRGREGELRALSNVCTHRASLLASGAGNCGRNLVCSYHGWIFGLDGRLLGVPYRTGFTDIDQEALGLPELRTAVMGPLVFVNPSCSAEPLADLWPIDPDWSWSQATMLTHEVEEVEQPWKVLIDRYLVQEAANTALVFAAFVCERRGRQLVLRYWEPIDIARTRVQTIVLECPSAESDSYGGPRPDPLLAWWELYAQSLVTATAI
ncbi:MAG: Rieske 2Fe-2S domain-containing protein [Actinobacteria bacterium]|uniref:Unannotated protein n=1 Tax=freshwater metagenome TaxID=449393 RepID=A0A6J6WRV8_9ZZZZ|nr:Rieske 2Fe-2S domain-containing protein [Actinomycetota bacterium]